MGVRDRIIELVFPGLLKDRRKTRENLPGRRRDRRRDDSQPDGYDPRYFIRHGK